MPEFLLTGRDARGKSRTERVEAQSANEAVRIACDVIGLDDVVLHTDDAGALYSRQADLPETFTPRDFLRFRDLPAPIAGFLLVARAIYVRSWGTMALAIGLLAFRRWQGYVWNGFDWLQVAFLAWPCVFAMGAQLFRGKAGVYNRLLHAASWGRWDEVLRHADALEGGLVPSEELAFRRGQALAGLGRLEEGLALVRPFGDGVTMPEWLYYGRLPDLYGTAKQNDRVRASLERATELAPENPTVLLDLARFEVRYGQTTRRARELLAEARRQALSDLLVPFATMIEGQIAREEGRPRDAVPLLEEAHRRLAAFRHASPVIGVPLDLLEAELALAHANAGDHDAAVRHAKRALPRLQALKSDDLIDRLRVAIGPGFDAAP